MANIEAWHEGNEVAKRNMERVHKMQDKLMSGPMGMMGSKKHGGKIKRTGKYKLHKGEKEMRGKKVVRKVKRTGPYRAEKGDYIKTAKKRSRRKKG